MQFNKALQHTIAWRAGNTLLNFMVNLLMVRLLGAELSGTFYYALTALSFVILVFSCSIEAAITYYGSKDGGIISSITSILLPWMLFQALICWLVLKYIPFTLTHLQSFVYVMSNLAIV